ncbi:hypothetical protein AAFF_G00412840 [Aldrovandia affinis]|uniref:Uncharacterized protein n=1 Tax=Aldrovandia affinis TaxID=143900 RepID=A0AAD7SD92_9TELE|nr:hypothetical protein AAFF_G00412840 [Aldrovandia affinis]
MRINIASARCSTARPGPRGLAVVPVVPVGSRALSATQGEVMMSEACGSPRMGEQLVRVVELRAVEAEGCVASGVAEVMEPPWIVSVPVVYAAR